MSSRNRLGEEKSPYLLQHRDNPVHWYAWGEAAFQAARSEDKPIFLSIGYSTCHWCHVMAHQSFEDQEVADYLNAHFVSIKVDREERPDVDEIYMSAVHTMGQRGGWPLSMFLTPDLKPFFGGTYWPKANFLHLLGQIQKMWREERVKAAQSAQALVEHLRGQKETASTPAPLNIEVLRKFYRFSETQFDSKWGGFGGAPKFPHAMQLSMLLRIHRRTGSERALQMAIHSLEMMARGGLFDHLGGGFARYSVDERWHIPHFEKMLYDNALLTFTYLEAYQVTGIEMFKRVAIETLNYTLRVMTHPEGGFYSAEDADSEGEEGKFYVWTLTELHNLLTPEELEHFVKVYNVTQRGNFEHGTNHFNLNIDFGWEEKDHPLIRSAREKLFLVREKRIHPHKDDKILTAWNGLMIRAMAKAYQVTGEEIYLQAARRAADFIRDHLFSNERLLARYREGEARFSGRLEDYAFLIEGLTELYQCDFRPEILNWAVQLQGIQNQLFWDRDKGGFFFTDGEDKSLLLRSKEAMDGALPNGNAVSILNLLRLEGLAFQAKYRDYAEQTFAVFAGLFSEYPHACAQMAMAYDYFSEGGMEVVLISEAQDKTAAKFIRETQEAFLPNKVLAWGRPGDSQPELLEGRKLLQDKATLYLCRQQSCEAPLTDLAQGQTELARPAAYTLNFNK
jgi:hypothetical protein